MRLEENTIGAQTPPGYRRIKKRYKRRRSKKRYYVLIGVCLFLAVLGTTLSTFGYLVLNDRYHQDLALAQTGAQDLQIGTALMQTILHDPLNTEDVGNAQHHFTSALTSFTRLESDLAPLPEALTSAPVYGTRLQAARHLLPLAIAVARAGLAGFTLVGTVARRCHQPLNAQARGRTTAALAVLPEDLRPIKPSL